MYKIGVLGGTFDPVHIGHLILADQAVDAFGLSKILFVPSGRPPHKDTVKITPIDHRLEMVRRAIAGNRLYEASEIEYSNTDISYTYMTLEKLRGIYGLDAEIFYIVGSDVLHYITKFKKFKLLLASCTIIACTRTGDNMQNTELVVRGLSRDYDARILIMKFPEIDISSSMIRKKISDGKSVRYMLPDSVINYININKLYTEWEETTIPGYWESIPVPTPAPMLTPVLAPTAVPTPTPVLTSTPVPVPTPASVLAPTPTPVPASAPTLTPTITSASVPVPVPAPAPMLTPVLAPTAVPTPTPTLTPVLAPKPTPEAGHEHISIYGDQTNDIAAAANMERFICKKPSIRPGHDNSASIAHIMKLMSDRLSVDRFRHTIGTMDTAIALAKSLGVDSDLAAVAALLHDCMRETPIETQIALCESGGVPIGDDELMAKAIIHAPAGAVEACKLIDADSVTIAEITDAIASHTTGREGMNLLAKIIFVADYIEPSRDFDTALSARAMLSGADINIERFDATVLFLLERQIEHIEAKGRAPHPDTVRARDWLVENAAVT